MSRVFCLILFLGIINSTDLFSQEDVSFGKLKRQGIINIHDEDYEASIGYFEQALEKKFNLKLSYQLLNLYIKSRKYNQALNLAKKIYEHNPDKNIEALYYYAMNTQSVGDTYMSEKSLDIFYKNSSREGEQGELRKQAKALLNFFKEYDADVVVTENNITNTSVLNTLVRYDKEKQRYLYNNTVEIIISDENFSFTQTKSQYVDYADRILIRDDFIKNQLSQQAIIIPENNRCYFLLPDVTDGLAVFYLNIDSIHSNKVNAVYDDVLNTKSSNVAAIVRGIDSKSNTSVIYMSSNREGSRGEYDIWYSKWSDRYSNFTIPKNLGGKINSEANELVHVYLPDEKQLFFSSDRIPGYGGYDLYSSIGELRSWVTPDFLPVNSSSDDYFISEHNGEWVFYSNRTDKSELNWTQDKLISFEGFKVDELFITGQINADSISRLPDFLLERLNSMGFVSNIENSNINTLLYIRDGSDMVLKSKQNVLVPGSYVFKIEPEFDYALSIHDGYGMIDSFNINKTHVTDSDTLFMPNILVNRILPDSIIVPLYYEFNQARLTSIMKGQIDSLILPLLNIFPDAGVKINAHTDSIGSYAYNIKLSKKRAKAIYHYIVENLNYQPQNMQFEGYGYTNPIVPNTNPDGTDNPQGRKLNRRAEVVFIRQME